MKVAGLFSGIGGFELGLERAGMEIVAFCENDKKCQLVLKKHWPDVPTYGDIRELTHEQLKADEIPTIDLMCGGFPCQPFSNAGKRTGKPDDRYLWPEMFRVIKEVRPAWVVGENVTGIVSLALDQVLSDLENEGYATRTFNIPACAVNAPHQRKRIWIVAYSKHGRWNEGAKKTGWEERVIAKRLCRSGRTKDVVYPTSPRLSDGTTQEVGQLAALTQSKRSGCGNVSHPNIYRTIRNQSENGQGIGLVKNSWWKVEPDVGRVANGVPGRVDRLKQLGNAVVPQIVEIIGRAIMEVNR